MNGEDDRFVLHWGRLIIGGTLAVGALVILPTLGWRWLWLLPAALAAYWVFMFIVCVFEDGWLAVTPEHVRRGVPDACSRCGAELDVVLRKARFKTRCPLCGRSAAGVLRDPG